MQYQVYRESNFIQIEEQKLFFLIRGLSLLVLASTLGIVLGFISEFYCIINSFICVFVILLCGKAHAFFHDNLLIKVDNRGVEYFSHEEGRLVTVNAEDIIKITTGFCQLHVHTRDSVHLINMETIKKEKIRWEVKEMVKQMAKQASFSVAS